MNQSISLNCSLLEKAYAEIALSCDYVENKNGNTNEVLTMEFIGKINGECFQVQLSEGETKDLISALKCLLK